MNISITMGFSVLVMLLLLFYSCYRLYIRKQLIMMILTCFQLFALSILAVGFIRGVQSENYIEALCMIMGIAIPIGFLIHDYIKMINKMKEYGTFEGLVEAVKYEGDEDGEYSKTTHLCSIVKERQVPELVNYMNVNKDEILKNIKKSLSNAHYYIDRSEYKEALEIYNILTKIVSNSPGMFFNQGNLYYRLEQYAGALSAYRKALEVNEKQVKTAVEPKDILTTEPKKKVSKAMNILFKTADEMIYEDYMVYFNMGNTYFRLNRFPEAIDSYEKVLELNPGLDEARENIARSFILLNKKTEALAYYKGIVDNDSKNYFVHYTYGKLLSELKNYDEAIESFNKSFSINKSHFDNLTEIAKIHVVRKNYEEAIRVLNQLIKKSPQDYSARYNLGLTLFAIGKKDEAVNNFKMVLELKENHYHSLFNLGVILDEKGETDEAIHYLKQAIDAKDDFIHAYNNLGIILSTQERYMEALEVYVRGLKKNPEEGSLYLNMGITLEELGRYDDAESAYRNAIDISPEDEVVKLHLAGTLVELKRYEEAVGVYKEVLKIKPEDSVVYYYIASANCMQKKYDAAIDNLKKAVLLDSSLKEEAKSDRAFDSLKSRADFRSVVA